MNKVYGDYDGEDVAIAHHWLVTYRGGEKVLSELRAMFPAASLATLICQRGQVPDCILGKDVITSKLQYFPFSGRYYKILLPLYPWAVESIVLPSRIKLLISSDASVIKGVRVNPGAIHICYCHSPPRYIWDRVDDYVNGGLSRRLLIKIFLKLSQKSIQNYDRRVAARVNYFVANSQFVAGRISRYYNRQAKVIYPPVDISWFQGDQPLGSFYLIVSQLVPYKRVDLAVAAFSRSKDPLVVIGEGSELSRLRRIAPPNVQFLGRQSSDVLRRYMETCRAFINPQVEDFGIATVEAQAAGRPVVAFGLGGATEIIVDGQTGVLFNSQTVDSLLEGITRLELIIGGDESALRARCRENAQRFSRQIFRARFKEFIDSKIAASWLG
jgi:glycosyltransferase involved in cell wall biosynthesis